MQARVFSICSDLGSRLNATGGDACTRSHDIDHDQSEGVPRTRYDIPAHVGLGVGSSKKLVPRAPFVHVCFAGAARNLIFAGCLTELN